MATDLRITPSKPSKSPVASQPIPEKGTLHQGFTYTILIDAETISNALFDTVTQQVRKHLPTFDRGLKVLTAHSTALALRNTTYEQRTGNQAQVLKNLREDLAKYRGAQTTFHNNYQGLVVFTREIVALVRCLKPSPESIYMRTQPSTQEIDLVTQAKELDKLKSGAYTKAKETILVQVNSLKRNMYENLGAFDTQMQKLEKRGRDMEASQKSMLSMAYWWTSPLQVEDTEPDLTDVDEADYDKPDSYEDYLRKMEASSSTTPTPPPTSNTSALPPNLRNLVDSEIPSGKVTTTVEEETTTPSDPLPPASSSSLDTSTTIEEIPPVDTSTTSPELQISSSLGDTSTPSDESPPKPSSLTDSLTISDELPSSTIPSIIPPPGLKSNNSTTSSKHPGASKGVVYNSTLPLSRQTTSSNTSGVITNSSEVEWAIDMLSGMQALADETDAEANEAGARQRPNTKSQQGTSKYKAQAPGKALPNPPKQKSKEREKVTK